MVGSSNDSEKDDEGLKESKKETERESVRGIHTHGESVCVCVCVCEREREKKIGIAKWKRAKHYILVLCDINLWEKAVKDKLV